MPRRRFDDRAAAAALCRWLSATAGLHATAGAARDAEGKEGAPDLMVEMADGSVFVGEVKAAAHPSAADLDRQLRRYLEAVTPGRRLVLVADLIGEEARATLRAAGVSYFDRRGEAFLTTGSTTAHVVGEAVPRTSGRAAGQELGQGAGPMSVALAALYDPETPVSVRALARAAALAPTTIAEARQGLRDAALLDPSYRAVPEALFEAAAAVWKPRRVGLARRPDPDRLAVLAAGGRRGGSEIGGDLIALARLGADAGAYEGPALAGTRAAIAYGAGLVAAGGGPVDFYVPDEGALERVVAWAGRAELDEREAGVAAAPSRLVCRLRRPDPQEGGFALAHPLVVALELATDPARGREALARFDPPGATRVW